MRALGLSPLELLETAISTIIAFVNLLVIISCGILAGMSDFGLG